MLIGLLAGLEKLPFDWLKGNEECLTSAVDSIRNWYFSFQASGCLCLEGQVSLGTRFSLPWNLSVSGSYQYFNFIFLKYVIITNHSISLYFPEHDGIYANIFTFFIYDKIIILSFYVDNFNFYSKYIKVNFF